jgi:putative chitinase
MSYRRGTSTAQQSAGRTVTPEQLKIATGCKSLTLAQEWCPRLVRAMGAYYVDLTPERAAMFLANVGHESGGLHYTSELWGPTPAQKRYEGRKDLGNTQPGDGRRFRGHGLFQTTGRYNHAAVRDRLRAKFPELDVPDFEEFPELLAQPEWAALSAADFADMVGLNAVADTGDFDGYCDRVNIGRKTSRIGDANGYAERADLYRAALAVLA